MALSTIEEHVIRELIKDNRLAVVDYHGRRIANAEDPFDPQDYATKNYVDTEIDANIASVGLLVDTDIPSSGRNLTVEVKADNSNIPGNSFDVLFYWPLSNIFSGRAWWVFVHDSGTLPTVTAFDSGTAGSLVAGVNKLTDTTQSWTPSALVGKDVIVFSDKRSGSPTHDLEGQIIFSEITANTATEITFDRGKFQSHTLTGLSYYIVTRNAGNHLHEKLKYVTYSGEDIPNADRQRARFTGGTGTLHFWVCFENIWGMGKVAASSTSKAFVGIVSGEITGTVLSDIRADMGNFTAGTITLDSTGHIKAGQTAYDTGTGFFLGQSTGVKFSLGNSAGDKLTWDGSSLAITGTLTASTFKTATSGDRIEIDSTNGLRAYGSGGGTLYAQIPISGDLEIQVLGIDSIGSAMSIASGTNKNFIANWTDTLWSVQYGAGSPASSWGAVISVSSASLFLAPGIDLHRGGGSAIINSSDAFVGTGGMAAPLLTGTIDTARIAGSYTGITAVGTIATGTWQGTAIASAYLDADTAHLSTTQTFSGAKTFTLDATFSADILLTNSESIIWGADATLTASATADSMDFTTSAVKIFQTDMNNSATAIGLWALHGAGAGTLKQFKTESINHGSGAKNWVYV